MQFILKDFIYNSEDEGSSQQLITQKELTDCFINNNEMNLMNILKVMNIQTQQQRNLCSKHIEQQIAFKEKENGYMLSIKQQHSVETKLQDDFGKEAEELIRSYEYKISELQNQNNLESSKIECFKK